MEMPREICKHFSKSRSCPGTGCIDDRVGNAQVKANMLGRSVGRHRAIVEMPYYKNEGRETKSLIDADNNSFFRRLGLAIHSPKPWCNAPLLGRRQSMSTSRVATSWDPMNRHSRQSKVLSRLSAPRSFADFGSDTSSSALPTHSPPDYSPVFWVGITLLTLHRVV